MAAYTITVWLEKGGVGKTTITTNLAAILAKRGKRVLVVDTDAQGDATQALTGFDVSDDDYDLPALYDMFLAYPSGGIKECISQSRYKNLDIIPASVDTGLVEGLLENYGKSKSLKVSKNIVLKAALSSVKKDYDYILIDAQPRPSVIVNNALFAADGVLMPSICSKTSRDKVYRDITYFKDRMEEEHESIHVLGIVLNAVGSRTTAADLTREDFETPDMGKLLLQSEIRKSQIFDNSTFMEEPAAMTYKSSAPVKDYEALCDEIEQRIINEKKAKG